MHACRVGAIRRNRESCSHKTPVGWRQTDSPQSVNPIFHPPLTLFMMCRPPPTGLRLCDMLLDQSGKNLLNDKMRGNKFAATGLWVWLRNSPSLTLPSEEFFFFNSSPHWHFQFRVWMWLENGFRFWTLLFIRCGWVEGLARTEERMRRRRRRRAEGRSAKGKGPPGLPPPPLVLSAPSRFRSHTCIYRYIEIYTGWVSVRKRQREAWLHLRGHQGPLCMGRRTHTKKVSLTGCKKIYI